MKTFVTGKFSTLTNATLAVERLHRACISRDRVCTVPLESSQNSQTGMDANSAVCALEQRSADRPDGVLVAVDTPDHVSRVLAVSVLRDYGANIVTSKANFTPNKN
jgi:hypothetical protein